jgi:hypothetical protein
MRRFLLALCALTLLSGCGGGVDASLLATAVRNTEAAGGAELAFQWTFHLPGSDQPVVITGSGVEDVKGQRAQITADVPTAGEMEVIADGFVMYMRFDPLSEMLDGKDWMKLDLERTNEQLGIEVDSLGQVGQGTAEQLQMLEQVSDGVIDEGRELVRGVEATHYSATIDLRRYTGRNIDKLIEITGQSQFPIDVWIDDDEVIRRIEWEQVLGQGQARMEIVAEYVRFGVPVDIEIPDDDDVFDATELAAQQLEQRLD